VWDSPRVVNVAAAVLAAFAFSLLAYAGGRIVLESPAFLL